MDSRAHGEDDGDCLRMERYSTDHARRPSPLSYWTLQALRSLSCQGGFVERKKLFYACGSRHSCSAAAAVPLLHRPLSYGLSSPANIQPKFDPSRCCTPFCLDVRMREFYINPLASVDLSVMESSDDQCEQISCDGASSSVSADCLSSDAFSVSLGDTTCEHGHVEDCSSSTDGSSTLGWPLCRGEKSHSAVSAGTSKSTVSSVDAVWEDKREKRETQPFEIGIRREKFAKLLLGEDMSGGGKGVSTALAISNAITNLSASVFGELWRLEPLSSERKTMWRREMEWLLSVADYIVELVPSWQTFPDGGGFEVMIGKPRSDLQINLPALRKLDAMLLESLDSFSETEIWYVDKGIVFTDDDGHGQSIQRQEEKWWLPSPKLPANGLSSLERKRLQHQRDCVSQILKASMEINSQILSEMEIPTAYWDALPKSGRASLGETIYKQVTSEYFSPDALLCMLDLFTEHDAVEVLNRIEAAVHLWRRRRHLKNTNKLEKDSNRENAKNSWSIVKDFVITDRRELLAERAETLLLCLKQKFPGLRQSLLDMTKIQYNKDVGQAILESYSRVMESLAFTIMARIDDVLYVDDLAKRASVAPPTPGVKFQNPPSQKRCFPPYMSASTPFDTPLATPSQSPEQSPNTPFTIDQHSHILSSDSISHNYEFKNGRNDENHGYKKTLLEQQSKTKVMAKALNNSKAQSIHPVQD